MSHYVDPNKMIASIRSVPSEMVRLFNSRDEESLNMICRLWRDYGLINTPEFF